MNMVLPMTRDCSSTLPGYMTSVAPFVRGRLTANYNMSRITWFRVGGAAEVFFSTGRPL